MDIQGTHLPLRVCLAGTGFQVQDRRFLRKKDLIKYFYDSCSLLKKYVYFTETLDQECDCVLYSDSSASGPPKTYLKYGIPTYSSDDFLKQFHHCYS